MSGRVLLFGYGLIGETIKQFLTANGYMVVAVDHVQRTGVDIIFNVKKEPHTAICDLIVNTDTDYIINAMPYMFNTKIARAVAATNTLYFDLSEDTQSAKDIWELAQTHPQAGFMTRCGLAPGAVGIIAYDLMQTFDTVLNVNMRVGALPRATNNHMQYYLTWSSEGLINEYCNECQVVRNYKVDHEPALEGYELISIDGIQYEAFNTSGGIGSLLDMVQSTEQKISAMDYKTMRYPGHHQLIKFLYDDLNMGSNKELFTKLFNQSVPHIYNDVVVIYVQVTGMKNGRYVSESYTNQIYGEPGLSAIQKTTASGVCAAVHWAASGARPAGLIFNEAISRSLDTNPFWDVYRK
jgi:saccharopine dehydrogenase-like NADP-dependent oxidoreductase